MVAILKSKLLKRVQPPWPVVIFLLPKMSVCMMLLWLHASVEIPYLALLPLLVAKLKMSTWRLCVRRVSRLSGTRPPRGDSIPPLAASSHRSRPSRSSRAWRLSLATFKCILFGTLTPLHMAVALMNCNHWFLKCIFFSTLIPPLVPARCAGTHTRLGERLAIVLTARWTSSWEIGQNH